MNRIITTSIEKTIECVLSNEVFCKNNRYFYQNVHPRPNKNPHPTTINNKYSIFNFQLSLDLWMMLG